MPVSPLPASSASMVSPNGSLPDLEGTGYRAGRKSRKCSHKLRTCRYSCRAYPSSKIASKRFPIQWPPTRLRLWVSIIGKLLVAMFPIHGQHLVEDRLQYSVLQLTSRHVPRDSSRWTLLRTGKDTEKKPPGQEQSCTRQCHPSYPVSSYMRRQYKFVHVTTLCFPEDGSFTCKHHRNCLVSQSSVLTSPHLSFATQCHHTQPCACTAKRLDIKSSREHFGNFLLYSVFFDMTEVHEIREMHCFPVFLGSSFNVVRLLQSKLETFVNFPFFVYCRLCHRFRIGKRAC